MADGNSKPNPEEPGQPAWKARFTERCRSEGRWPEVRARRIALENSGVATEESWIQAYREFPPLGSDAPEEVKAELAAERHAQIPKGRKRLDYRRDVLWVAEKLNRLQQKQIGVDAAPSAIAWNLGQWAVSNPASFWKDVASKYLKDEDGGEEGRFDDRGEQLRLIDIFEREEAEARERVASVESGEVGAS